MLQRFAAAYFGGAMGALAVVLVLWILGRAKLTQAIGVNYAPSLSFESIAAMVLGGSLWALGYPFVRRRGPGPRRSGLILAVAPALAQLFYFLPRRGYGLLGMEMGLFTPLVVLAAAALWGFVVARVASRMGT